MSIFCGHKISSNRPTWHVYLAIINALGYFRKSLAHSIFRDPSASDIKCKYYEGIISEKYSINRRVRITAIQQRSVCRYITLQPKRFGSWRFSKIVIFSSGQVVFLFLILQRVFHPDGTLTESKRKNTSFIRTTTCNFASHYIIIMLIILYGNSSSSVDNDLT